MFFMEKSDVLLLKLLYFSDMNSPSEILDSTSLTTLNYKGISTCKVFQPEM